MSKREYNKWQTNGHAITIYHDDYAENPRTFDNIGTFVMWHRKYAYGDINNPSEEEGKRLSEEANAEGSIKLPVFMMDHSGLSFSVGSFGDPWDSGQVGFIYATKEKIDRELGQGTHHKLTMQEYAIELLKSEIKTLDLYARGDCYGYAIYELQKCPHCHHIEEIEIDSCWGFITDEPIECVLDQLGTHYRQMFEEVMK